MLPLLPSGSDAMLFAFQRLVDRREFFRAAARNGSLTMLGVAAWLLARRRGGQSCRANGVCRRCAAFRVCGLPAALSAKAAQARGKGPGA